MPIPSQVFPTSQDLRSRELVHARRYDGCSRRTYRSDSSACEKFGTHVEKCVLDLQDLFRDGLEDKCQVGAANAAKAAVLKTHRRVCRVHALGDLSSYPSSPRVLAAGSECRTCNAVHAKHSFVLVDALRVRFIRLTIRLHHDMYQQANH